jgi:hypothetical protein
MTMMTYFGRRRRRRRRRGRRKGKRKTANTETRKVKRTRGCVSERETKREAMREEEIEER